MVAEIVCQESVKAFLNNHEMAVDLSKVVPLLVILAPDGTPEVGAGAEIMWFYVCLKH